MSALYPVPSPSPGLVRWRSLLPGALLVLVTLWLLRDTARDMVSIWIRSETFTHAFLVPPIVLWLVWRRRADLAQLSGRSVPWLLLPMALACLLWLVGEVATVAALSQFALVTLVVLAVPALFGFQIARVLTFPLAFLYFAVPFGEFLVPQLMEWTADFTVVALRLSGIPVFREGLQFVIPSGTWSVVEACSGVRYLIASFMVGTLFAYLNYRSTRRRVIFSLIALAVPVIANWVRAYLIVMIGHLSGNELAVGVDHLVYGWAFFGIVVGLMFFIGARWAEPEVPGPVNAEAISAPAPSGRQWVVAVVGAGLVAATQAWSWQLNHVDEMSPPALVAPAEVAEFGPARAEPALPWMPGFRNPISVAQAAYGADERPVWLWVGYYRQQGPDRKLVSSVNGVVATDDPGWTPTEVGLQPATADMPMLHTTSLRRGGMLENASMARLRVWHVYWVGGRWTASETRVKLWQAFDSLSGRGDDGAVVLFATAAVDDADAVLAKFSRAVLPAIGPALAAARDTR